MENQPYQQQLDRLIAFATREECKDDVLAAKRRYFELVGETHEDDKSFEMRMAGFLDWYLFDRISSRGSTPAEEFAQVGAAMAEAPEDVAVYRAFTKTRHSLFEVRKLSKGTVRLRDLLSGKDSDVTERRQVAGMEKGDILEARLIPVGEHLLFSSAFLYHPREAAKSILAELKRRKKNASTESLDMLMWECAKMALKAERYRQIAIERIYDFENRKL